MTFRIYDGDMNEVNLPKDSKLHYGSYPLELNIGGFEYEKRGDRTVPIGRSASIRAFIISSDESDMDMKMDNVYAFFRQLGKFYVAKPGTPFKLLKVEADQSYSITPGNGVLTEFEIPLTVQKPYFKQSLHTTLDIDQEGIQFNNKWAYGMGTWFPENYDQYSFVSTAESIVQPTFFNAGTEEVKFIQQKESVIEIKLNQSANWFEIMDDAGNIFRIDRTMYTGDMLRISGSEVTLNGEIVIGDTNYTFLVARKGWCRWEIRNLTRFEFKIDFRFLYD